MQSGKRYHWSKIVPIGRQYLCRCGVIQDRPSLASGSIPAIKIRSLLPLRRCERFPSFPRKASPETWGSLPLSFVTVELVKLSKLEQWKIEDYALTAASRSWFTMSLVIE